MVREYISGQVVEESKYWAPRTPRNRTRRKRGTTSPQKRDENDRSAVKRLARSINCNFTYGDLFICLEYDEQGLAELRAGLDDPEDMQQMRVAADKELKLFLRRIKRALAKGGTELKYIAVTSDMDGETGEVTRLHHHIIMQRLPFETVQALWRKGGIRYDTLRNQADYTPLAVYMLRQVTRQPDEKKYSVSRNLSKPKITERIVSAEAELKAPKGAKLVYRSEYDIERKTQYMRYIAPPKKEKRGGKREYNHIEGRHNC